MRDLFLLIIFPILLYFIFRRPYIGVSLWIWSGMFFPNGWVWGIASGIRYNLLIALATLLSLIFQKDRIRTDMSGITVAIIIFFIWSTIASVLTLSNPDVVWREWNLFMKIIVFYIFCILALKTKHHVLVFIWAIALSASYFGAGEGVKYVLSAGGHILKGIEGSRLEDRNELALAINMTIPLLIFLLGQTKNKILRLGLLGAIAFSIIAIVGSFSRGGLLGLIVVGGYFFLQSQRKLLVVILLVFATAGTVALAPASWFERMDSIDQMTEDDSFLGRIAAWKLSLIHI